jgi:hypothetical protein
MSSPCGLFNRAEDAFQTSDDVIEEVFTIIPAICRALFQPLRNPLGALPDSNRRFKFEKCT